MCHSELKLIMCSGLMAGLDEFKEGYVVPSKERWTYPVVVNLHTFI